MSGCGTCACAPVGTGTTTGGTHTIVNVGGEVEAYVTGTGPNPFEIRTFESSNNTVGVSLGVGGDTIDFVVKGADLVSLDNVGAGAEVWVEPTGPMPFDLRTVRSPLGSVDVVQTADEIQLEVTGENVGLFIQIYVAGSVGPFQWRSLQSSDSTVSIVQNLTDIDFTVDIESLMSIANVGTGAEVWVDPSGPDPFNLRSVRSPLGTVDVVETATEIQLEVDLGGVKLAFETDSLAIKSTTSTTYQLVANLAGDAKVLDGETWRLQYGLLVCHPANVFTVNTFIEWRIETAAAVFTLFDEWQINAPITIQVGEPSMPFSMPKKLVANMDAPRMQCNVKMSAVQASATQVEMPRWGGDLIAEAP